MALHLAIADAPGYLDDIEQNAAHGRLPVHRDDYGWGECSEMFFQDHDVLMLLRPRFEGIERPDTEENQRLGIGDFRVRHHLKQLSESIAGLWSLGTPSAAVAR